MNIDQQLLDDCHQIGLSQNVLVLLHKNATLPWFIFVPLGSDTSVLASEGLKERSYREVFELPLETRRHLEFLSDTLSRYLIATFGVYKINTGALGNVVEQLHFHLVGRFKNDPCWPDPVWGNLAETKDYSPEHLEQIRTQVRELIPFDSAAG